MKNPLNSIPLSMIAPAYLGKHKGCGGSVYYHSGRTWGLRRCNECLQDGRHGTLSPVLEGER